MCVASPNWKHLTADYLWKGRSYYDALEARFEAEALMDDPAYQPCWFIETVEPVDDYFVTVHKEDIKQ